MVLFVKKATRLMLGQGGVAHKDSFNYSTRSLAVTSLPVA